jgi:excisionase family DNA binding protein
MSSDPTHAPALAVTLTLSEEQFETLVQRVVDRLAEGADHGFLDVDGAARFLGGCSRSSIYHLVQRQKIRAHRRGGRLFFDPAELRRYVENGA